jgi:uncharacterized Tic20 family protein
MKNEFFFDFSDMFGFMGGISLIGILGIIRFVLVTLAAVKANNGEFYKYPLTLKFIK